MIAKRLNEHVCFQWDCDDLLASKNLPIDASFNAEYITPPPSPSSGKASLGTLRQSSLLHNGLGSFEPKTVTITFLSLANSHAHHQQHPPLEPPKDQKPSRQPMEVVEKSVPQLTWSASLNTNFYSVKSEGGEFNEENPNLQRPNAPLRAKQRKTADQLFSSVEAVVSASNCGSVFSDQCNWSTNGVCHSRDDGCSSSYMVEAKSHAMLPTKRVMEDAGKGAAVGQERSSAQPSSQPRHSGATVSVSIPTALPQSSGLPTVFPDPSQNQHLHLEYPYLHHLCCPLPHRDKSAGSSGGWPSHERRFTYPSGSVLPQSARELMRFLLLRVLHHAAVLKEKIGPVGGVLIERQLAALEWRSSTHSSSSRSMGNDPIDFYAPLLSVCQSERKTHVDHPPYLPEQNEGNVQLAEDIFRYALDRLLDLCASTPSEPQRFTRVERIFASYPIQCIVLAIIIISCRYWSQEAFFRIGFTRNDVLRHLTECFPTEWPLRVLTPALLTDLEMQIVAITRANLDRFYEVLYRVAS